MPKNTQLCAIINQYKGGHARSTAKILATQYYFWMGSFLLQNAFKFL